MTNKLIEAIMLGGIEDIDEEWESYAELAQAALKAISDNGYVVVPREPTEAMLEAAEHVAPMFTPADIYRAMINATTTEEI